MVKHTIGETWDTELETEMYNIPTELPDASVYDMSVSTEFLRNTLDMEIYKNPLKQSISPEVHEKTWFYEMFSNLKPKLPTIAGNTLPTNIKYIFECTIAKDGVANQLDHTLWTTSTGDFKSIVEALKPAPGTVKPVFKHISNRAQFPNDRDEWAEEAVAGTRITGGCQVTVTGLKKGNKFYLFIHKNGKNWTIWPADPSTNWLAVNNLFASVVPTPPITTYKTESPATPNLSKDTSALESRQAAASESIEKEGDTVGATGSIPAGTPKRKRPSGRPNRGGGGRSSGGSKSRRGRGRSRGRGKSRGRGRRR